MQWVVRCSDGKDKESGKTPLYVALSMVREQCTMPQCKKTHATRLGQGPRAWKLRHDFGSYNAAFRFLLGTMDCLTSFFISIHSSNFLGQEMLAIAL